MPEPQTLKNHGRVVPMFHFGVFIPFLINFVWSIYRLRHGLTGDAVVGLLTATALLLLAASVRTQILTVQDRVIRLEMRLRLAQVLPDAMQVHIPALTVRQLVALRFAGDAELPALVDGVLAGKLSTGKAIKAGVQDWQADYQRA